MLETKILKNKALGHADAHCLRRGFFLVQTKNVVSGFDMRFGTAAKEVEWCACECVCVFDGSGE